MSRELPPALASGDEHRRPSAKFGPAHLISEDYVRRSVAVALRMPEEPRRFYWIKRRAYAARRLYESGLNADEVSVALKAFNARARREAEVRRLLMRVEAETAADGGDP